jgi:UDP-N-acetylmuramate: L-alanyl-gamma-D-glutamyl-meso-diaminopimelate ligase
MQIHILGICGTLMGSIALLAREAGHQVSGMDQNVYPPMSTQLENAGIVLTSPYSSDIPDNTDLVIIGNAGLPRGNPAVEAVLDRRLDYVSGAEWLGRHLLPGRWVIAVSGTHGKTTTSSMVTWILEQAGLDPGYLIGGVPSNFGQSARLGSDPFFVIEADEYDTSYFDHQSKFLHYRPQTLVVNNLEFDHADIFPDLQAIKNQFHLLLRRIPGLGQVIYPLGDANVRDVIDMGCWSETLTVGGDHADICAQQVSADGSCFTVNVLGRTCGTVDWSLTGNHNVHNGLAAIAAARHAGVEPRIACEALCTFSGVKRRMETIHVSESLHVYDDFAHHPTAIAQTLAGLRARVGEEKILAIVEPASHTMRLGTHEKRLQQAVADADITLWYQPPSINWDMAQLQLANSEVIDGIPGLLARCLELVVNQQVDHLVIMSNGGFSGFHQQLLAQLEK